MGAMKARLDTLRTAVDRAKRMEKMERAMEGKPGAGGSTAGGGRGGGGSGSAEKGEADRPERAAAAALGYA